MNKSSLSSLSAIPKKQLIAPPLQPTRHLYDVIILGRQPAGLLAGALLAKRGLTILQIDPLGQAPYYEKDGTLFPISPSLTPSLKNFARLEPALFELGINLDLNRYQESHGHFLQIIRHRMRFDHSLNEETLRTEARRNFPDQADDVCEVFSRMGDGAEQTTPFFNAPIPFPPKGLWDRFWLRRPVRELFHTDFASDAPTKALPGKTPSEAAQMIRQCMDELTGYVSGFEQDNDVGIARCASHLAHGMYSIPGGSFGLSTKFGQRMLELGSDVLGCAEKTTPLEEIDFTFSKISGIRLQNSDSVIRATSYICAMDAQDFARLPILDKYASRILRFASPLVEDRRALVLNLLVKNTGLPKGLLPRALLFSKRMPEIGGILVETSQATTQSANLDNCSVLSVMIRVHAEDMDSHDKVKAIAAMLREILRDELCPFIDQHILKETIPNIDAGENTPPMAVTYQKPSKSYLGLSGLPMCTCFRNLFLANRQVLPSLGLEGEILTGIRLADLIQKKLHKYNPLK